ncbi:PDDEXK-like family protein [Sphingomonas faeni]|uniref:PDDEXK-like family protein n=1 Tax=Sphingomonas faeni TaxID=185950 RepID=UPI00278392DB|nr:PD-(D/E)XK nuclease family protein [Sphingomonas faeni]MDQ0839185.1 hypothetical protein [Sphingomonas faeni]
MIDDGISALLDDDGFWEIQKRMSRFNLFEAMGAVHGELRHSNFLAYLLSPSRPHGLGPRALQLILRQVLDAMPPGSRPVSILELLVGDLDDAIVHRERDSIDLLIEIDALDLVVVIENKVHAKAGDGQLRRYRELVDVQYASRRKLFVFLTPDGHAPDDEAYHALSYIQLADTLQTLASSEAGPDATQLIIQHYVDMLRRNIVEDEKLRGLAAKLYERHTEALDFIFASRPRTAGLVDVVGQEVRACGGLSMDSEGGSLMRFSVDRWDACDIFRIDPKEWSKTGRGLLFEVKSYAAKPGRLNISLIIGPGDQAYRKALHEAARARPGQFTGLTKSIGAKWVTIFSRDLLTAERAASMSAEAQTGNLRLAWSDFQATTLIGLIEAVLEMDAAIKRGRPSELHASPADRG